MSDMTTLVRQQYNATGLADRIRKALGTLAPGDQPLTVAQLAPLDQFHTRGIQARAELARAANVKATSHVLDICCGVGGPARYLAATFGCRVTGIDLHPGFIDTASYLTARYGLSERAVFQTGDALQLPFADGTFDTVFLQHVAVGLYAPLRVSLYEDQTGVVHFSYDCPSSLLGSFGDAEIKVVAQELDAKLATLATNLMQ